MQITIEEIKEHHDRLLRDMRQCLLMSIGQALKDGALFWIDHHDFVRALSEEIFATNREQLDA
jgi:hypothetical protein